MLLRKSFSSPDLAMADYLSRPATAPPELDPQQEPVYEVTDSGNTSMRVVVRVRPESEAELRSSCQCVVKVLDEHVLVFDPAGNCTQAGGKEGECKKPFAAFSSSPGESCMIGLDNLCYKLRGCQSVCMQEGQP